MTPCRPFAATACLAFAGALLASCQWLAPAPRAVAPAPARSSLAGVEARTMNVGDLHLASGVLLKDVQIAYETYGTLAPDGRNAVLVSHGNTSHHHAAGRYAPGKNAMGVGEQALGWWDALIGPGKAFDTDRYFVVSSNMLGGAFGSTGPRRVNPATGKPWGPDFPDLTLADIAAAQKALLGRLGVRHLVAVAGPSYGGFMAFEWATGHPDFVSGAVVVVSSPTGGKNPQAITRIAEALAKDPNWNGGWYYDRGGIVTALTDLRVATLKAYGIDGQLAAQFPDRAAREAEIRRRATPWAQAFDGHSLLVQRKAMEYRDHAQAFGRIRAKVLYVLATTDRLFPPSLAPGVMAGLKAAGVEATYVELESDKGHSAGTGDALKYEKELRAFLARL